MKMRGVHSIISSFIALLAFSGCATVGRKETILLISDSPNGKYQCVVTELPPPALVASPWMYTFTVKNRASGNELLGKRFKNSNDSAMIGADQLKFEWSGDDLKIDYGRNPYLKAKIRGNVQE